jgi:STE24 endopeptidase
VLLGLIFLPPIIAAFTAILQRSSPYVGLYLWAFLLGVQLFVVTVYPTVIAPLFNTYTPLPDGALKAAIEQLAASLAFPLKKLFVVDGSRRSAHSNAYMYGFGGNKRICLYDTLIDQASQEQVVAVLAHELGHWKLSHMPKLLAATSTVSLAQLLLFTAVRTSSGVFEDFGFPPGVRPALAGFLLFQQLIGPVDEVLGLLSNLVSRTFEFQADAFAASCGKAEDLKGALLVLDKENKGALASDPLYSAYHHSHPPLIERLAALDAASKKAE